MRAPPTFKVAAVGTSLLAVLAIWVGTASAQARPPLNDQLMPAQHRFVPVQDDSTADPGSAVAVVLGSVLTGTAIYGGWALLNFFCDPCPGPRSAVLVWAGGATAGALLGSAISKRKEAFTWTVLGAAVATAPLIIWAPQDEWGRGTMALVFILPVTGALIGNSIGQGRD